MGPRTPLTVIDVDHSAEGIALITLQTPDGAPLPGYEPGCHADFYISDDNGEELVRQYSLFPMTYYGREDKNSGCYGITAKLETNSRGGSLALHRVREHDTLTIGEPRSNFGLDPRAQHSVLVGAGVGIAPIYSLARELQRQGADYSVLYFASSEEQAIMSHLIDKYLSGKTRSIFATGARDKQAGYIEEALGASASEGSSTHLYVCGPQGFMDGAIEVAERHIPAENIHWERFRASEEALAGDSRADGGFEVEFQGLTFNVPADKSVLDVFEDEDLPIMSQCTEGTCGTCVMRVVEGSPDHRDSVFTEEQHEKGAFATCVSRSFSPKLVLERWRNRV